MIRFKAPGQLFWKTIVKPTQFMILADGKMIIHGEAHSVVLPAGAAVIFWGSSKDLMPK